MSPARCICRQTRSSISTVFAISFRNASPVKSSSMKYLNNEKMFACASLDVVTFSNRSFLRDAVEASADEGGADPSAYRSEGGKPSDDSGLLCVFVVIVIYSL